MVYLVSSEVESAVFEYEEFGVPQPRAPNEEPNTISRNREAKELYEVRRPHVAKRHASITSVESNQERIIRQ
jgi:hypothetical protein